MIADRSNGEPIDVAVDDEIVQVVVQRDAQLLIGLVDRAHDGAQILDVYRLVVVLDHVVEVLARSSRQDCRLHAALSYLIEQLTQGARSQHSVLFDFFLLIIIITSFLSLSN